MSRLLETLDTFIFEERMKLNHSLIPPQPPLPNIDPISRTPTPKCRRTLREMASTSSILRKADHSTELLHRSTSLAPSIIQIAEGSRVLVPGSAIFRLYYLYSGHDVCSWRTIFRQCIPRCSSSSSFLSRISRADCFARCLTPGHAIHQTREEYMWIESR